MPESQQDIDALLAEVNALAEETVASIAGGEEFAPAAVAEQPSPSPAPRSPSSSLSSLLPSSDSADAPLFVSRSVKSGRIATGTPSREPTEVTRILNIEVPIIVQLSARMMRLSEILNLSTGSIVEFDKPVDSELELRVNNKCIGSGQAVKVGENFGLRVVRTGTLRERIQALGG